MAEERNLRRSIQGVVVSNKNDKTIGVLVETHKRHTKYGKRVKYRKKYYAHDEKNEAKIGDLVTIMECRKLSATKCWRLVSIDKAADVSLKELEKEVAQEEERIVEEVEAKAEKPEAEKVEDNTEEVEVKEEKEAE